MADARAAVCAQDDPAEWISDAFLMGWKGYRDMSKQEVALEAYYWWICGRDKLDELKEFPARERRRIRAWIQFHTQGAL
jgi:hypothetical protein